MNTEFVPVKGFEKYYLVNRQGDVICLRNKNGKKKLKPYKDKDGYLRVRLYGENKKIWIGVHKIVAEAFLDNPNNYVMVNHKNYVRHDNRVENLEWCNAKENAEWSLCNYKGVGHKKVVRIDIHGNEKMYCSLSDAARDTNISLSNICIG